MCGLVGVLGQGPDLEAQVRRGLLALVAERALVEEIEAVADEVALLPDARARGHAACLDRRAGHHQLAEDHAVDVRAVADPALVVAQAEHVVGVDEAEHARGVDHEAPGDVARVEHRVRALRAGEGQLGVGVHPAADQVLFAVDLEQLFGVRSLTETVRPGLPEVPAQLAAMQAMLEAIAALAPGRKAGFELRRGKEKLDLKVEIGRRPALSRGD